MWNTVFGVTKEGKKAHRYILVNNKGMSVNYLILEHWYYPFMYLISMEEDEMLCLVMII